MDYRRHIAEKLTFFSNLTDDWGATEYTIIGVGVTVVALVGVQFMYWISTPK